MSKELREAALDIVRSFDACCSDRTSFIGIRKLARDYLAEHRADDDEPVSVEWLGTCRNVAQNDSTELAVVCPEKRYEFIITLNFDGSFSVNLVDGDSDVHLGDFNTRGDVRRLAKGLKIDLGE